MIAKKRKPRSYKCYDKNYNAAKKRAKKEGVKVANIIEDYLIVYGNGYDMYALTGVEAVGVAGLTKASDLKSNNQSKKK
jgi:hypothetical protein